MLRNFVNRYVDKREVNEFVSRVSKIIYKYTQSVVRGNTSNFRQWKNKDYPLRDNSITKTAESHSYD